MMEQRTSILVFTAKLAKQLLKLGYTVIDIKPHRDNKERTIFVFKNENGLESKIKELTYKSND